MMMGLDLILIALIGGVAYALGFRPQINPSRPADTSQTPGEILKARYASGEISREEYEQMRRDLGG
jgi:putative membrane protein